MRKRKQRNGGEKKIEGELGAIYAAGEAPLRSLRRPQSGSAPRSEHVRRENVVSLATRGMRNVEEFLRMESNSFSLSRDCVGGGQHAADTAAAREPGIEGSM